MTINGIWDWANTLSQKVPLESLRKKVLSIDGHIWLYESLKGCEAHHQQIPNTYLVTFYHRILRLMAHQITPIVVFDSVNSSSPAHEASDQSQFAPRKRRSFGDSPFTNLVDHVYKANVLLKNLGIRVIIAPGDGEAQCARLEELGVTSGCITTDFDYFLFGGKNLYRFNFGPTTMKSVALHDATHLSIGRINQEKKIARPHLISTAILLGCDYFQHGVQNVGIVTVFDILAEFGDEGSEDVDPHVILDRFASYVREEIPARSEDTPRKLRLRRKKYNFNQGFPNSHDVHNAIRMYKSPPVSNETPDLEQTKPVFLSEVTHILEKECGWTPETMRRDVVQDVKRCEKMASSMAQTRIPEYFGITKANKFLPIVEPCHSMDEYISAQKTWIRKRKQGEDRDSGKRFLDGRRRGHRISDHPKDPRTYSDDVITLDSD
uniref:XPGI domain-containing protein n=1 Tax=Caenorhabditis tropicalis TaxID=1561998 RepID=A0A1I7UMJ3_9PELO